MKGRFIPGLAVIVSVVAVLAVALAWPVAAHAESVVRVYRLYNPENGLHLLTTSAAECEDLAPRSWWKEGVAWEAPASGEAVYRLHNPYTGLHLYTCSANEYDVLGAAGWEQEGPAWRSAAEGIAVYRCYNPYTAEHHYTTSRAEYEGLCDIGWCGEDVAFRVVKEGGTLEPAPPLPQLKLSTMTLEQKVAQLFMLAPEAVADPTAGEFASAVTGVSDAMRANLARYPVGGVVFMGQNVVDPGQTSAFIRDLKQASRDVAPYVPVAIAVDEEGGTIARLAQNAAFGLPRYQSAWAVGATGNPANALAMGRTIGSYLRRYGFDIDFAPVADITIPGHDVMGTRTFGADSGLVASMAGSFAQGLRENGVIATFKHFPGHGGTAQDSHVQLATTNKTLDELRVFEFLPYRQVTAGDFVMVGHIAAPNATGDWLPATLSTMLVTGEIRGYLGFQGVVVTDALRMNAIANTYGSGEAAVRALEAGCDLLLAPENFEEAYAAVLDAVRDGRIGVGRIDQSVLRILSAKYR